MEGNLVCFSHLNRFEKEKVGDPVCFSHLNRIEEEKVGDPLSALVT